MIVLKDIKITKTFLYVLFKIIAAIFGIAIGLYLSYIIFK